MPSPQPGEETLIVTTYCGWTALPPTRSTRAVYVPGARFAAPTELEGEISEHGVHHFHRLYSEAMGLI